MQFTFKGLGRYGDIKRVSEGMRSYSQTEWYMPTEGECFLRTDDAFRLEFGEVQEIPAYAGELHGYIVKDNTCLSQVVNGDVVYWVFDGEEWSCLGQDVGARDSFWLENYLFRNVSNYDTRFEEGVKLALLLEVALKYLNNATLPQQKIFHSVLSVAVLRLLDENPITYWSITENNRSYYEIVVHARRGGRVQLWLPETVLSPFAKRLVRDALKEKGVSPEKCEEVVFDTSEYLKSTKPSLTGSDHFWGLFFDYSMSCLGITDKETMDVLKTQTAVTWAALQEAVGNVWIRSFY